MNLLSRRSLLAIAAVVDDQRTRVQILGCVHVLAEHVSQILRGGGEPQLRQVGADLDGVRVTLVLARVVGDLT